MELTRDQLLEIIDANDGNLNTARIPIDTIPEDIKIPGELKVKVSSGGKIRRIPAITVGKLIITGSPKDEIYLEIASGFQADDIYIDCYCNTNIIFGNDVHIVNDLRVKHCKRLVFGDRLVVGQNVFLHDIPDGVEFGQHLRIGQSIAHSGYRYLDSLSVKLSEDSEISFLNAGTGKEPGLYFELQDFNIKRLPARSKFYCSISCSSSDLKIDEDVYIAGNLGLLSPDALSFHFQNALHVDGILDIGVNGGEVYIPSGSQLGSLDVHSRPDAPVTYLRFGEGVHVKNGVGLGMTRLVNIPPRFRVDSGRIYGDASTLAEVAPDAYLGGSVKLLEYPLEHWPIKDNFGTLNLTKSKVHTLEHGANIRGDLILSGSSIEELVEVTVKGSLALNKSTIKRLAGVTIEGDLHICDCSLLRLLDGTTVKGVIHIGGTTSVSVLGPRHLTECAGLILTLEEDNDFRQALMDMESLFYSIKRPVQLKTCSFILQPRLEFQFT